MKVIIKPGTIFVSIASYRDPVCNSTLKSIYSMAENPKNVYCGVVQQNDEEKDSDCLLESTDSILTENVTMLRIKHYEAKGPTWPRYLASTLWSGEEYFLQIDSHSRFVKNWDTKCIQMMKRLSDQGIKKAVLSHYARDIKDFENIETIDPNVVTRLCQAVFNTAGMIKYSGADNIHTNNEFYESPFCSGNFLFAKYQLLKDVPFDPNLDFLFWGEEIGHSIRMWTSGYNIYTPTENILFHEYGRKEKPRYWDDNKFSDVDALEKIKQMIGLDSTHKLSENIKYNIDKYGLGKERSLEDYYKFAGIDTKNKIITKNFCRKDNVATPEDIASSKEVIVPEAAVEKKNTIESFATSTSQGVSLFFIVSLILIFSLIIYLIFFKRNHTLFQIIKTKGLSLSKIFR